MERGSPFKKKTANGPRPIDKFILEQIESKMGRFCGHAMRVFVCEAATTMTKVNILLDL
jgi:hypothetical protein